MTNATDTTNSASTAPTARERINDLRSAADRLADLALLTTVRDQAKARFGDEVHYLSVHIEDADNIESMHFMACGPDCEPLDDYPVAEGFQPFRSDLPTGMWATEDCLDMRILDQIDLDAEIAATEAGISSRHLARTALDSIVVDRACAIDTAMGNIQQGWDFASHGTVEALTDAEKEKVGDWFEQKWGGLGGRVRDDFYAAVDQALEDVLSQTRGR